MYLPEIFAESRANEISRLIAAHPLATLVYNAASGPDAQHIPLLSDGPERLIGHVAARSDLLDALRDGDPVLAIFTGADGYISPNWYPSKAEHHKHVPTWNYQVVHVRGTIHFLPAGKATLAVVGKLTRHFETGTNGTRAWKIADAPADYLQQMLASIRAFEIRITEVIAKSKLSQNREQRDFDSVQQQLEQRGNRELASSMRGVTDNSD